jgi:signal transduction histidine kinase
MLLEEGVLHLHAERGFTRLGAKPGHDVVTFIPEETAFATEVLAGDHPILVADAKTVPGWIWVPGSSHIRSWMGVPLRVHDQAIGMFSIDKSQPDFFTPRHAALAAAVAPHAAIAIENARLFRDLRSAESQLRSLTLHVIDVQESERQSIARELHDHAGQALLALRAELQILARQIPAESTAARGQLAKMDEVLRETARDLRLLSHELRSHLLDELGLASALQQQARDFTDRFSIKVDLVVQGDASRRRPRAIELAAFRLVQEALNNVARHAQAKTVRIRLSDLPGKLQLVVEDDGQGFDVDTILRQGTVGLIGMRERVAAVDGTLHLRSRREQGTQITAEFPDAGATR